MNLFQLTMHMVTAQVLQCSDNVLKLFSDKDNFQKLIRYQDKLISWFRYSLGSSVFKVLPGSTWF